MKIILTVSLTLVIISFLITVVSATIETCIHEKKHFFNIFFKEFWDDFKLVFKSVFIHKFSIRTLKHLEQIGLYFLEIFTVCGLFLVLENFWDPITPENLFSRFLTVFTAYQIFVYSVMSLINSAKFDEWLALVRIIRLQQLYNQIGSDYVKKELDKRIEESLNAYTFMTGKPKEYVQEIKDGVSAGYLDFLLIIAQHNVQANSSFWRFSFLLNSIKKV